MYQQGSFFMELAIKIYKNMVFNFFIKLENNKGAILAFMKTYGETLYYHML
jgi:hypothetical protein